MARLKLEDIQAKADEYVRIARRIERKEKAFDDAAAPEIESHEKKLALIRTHRAPQIDLDIAKAERLKSEIVAWLGPKKSSYSSEGKISEFGVVVGTKPGVREPDKDKLRRLCKRKGVAFDPLIVVMLGDADKALGKTAVDAISTKPNVATRDEYVRVKS